MQQPGKDQILVTGAGGPSGTGKRTTNELVLPPPVFVQDLSVAEKKKQISSSAAMEHRNQFKEDASQEETTTLPTSNSTTSLTSLEKSTQNSQSKNTDEDVSGAPSSQASTTLEQQQQRIQMNEEKLRQEQVSDGNESKGQSPSQTVPASSNDSAGRKSATDTSRQSTSPVSFTSNFSSLVSPSSFNGLGNCAVFPVPISSMSVSIWRNVLQSGTGDDLKVNPYAMISIPVTELFELTIPPVDAACMPSWPKPLSHYSQGIGANGVTHAPVGQHKYYSASSTASHESNHAGQQHSQNDMTPEQLQQYHQQKAYQQQQQQRANQQFRDSQQQQYAQHQFQHQQQQQQQQPNMAALQQIFPGVNMAFGGQGGNNSTQQVKR